MAAMCSSRFFCGDCAGCRRSAANNGLPGSRRFRAAKLAGSKTIKAFVFVWIKLCAAQGVSSDIRTWADLIALDEAGTVKDLQESIAGMQSISRADIERLSRPTPAAAPLGPRRKKSRIWSKLPISAGGKAISKRNMLKCFGRIPKNLKKLP